MYVLSQVFTAISYALYGSSYLTKNRYMLLVNTMLSSVFFIVAYTLLGATSAVYINVLSIIRQILLLIQEKNQSQRMYVYVFFFNVISTILVGVFTYEGIFSALPALGTLIFVYSSWQKDIKMYRLCGIFIEFNWLVYGIYLRSVVSIVMECILVPVVIYNFVKICKETSETEAGKL